MHVEKDILAEAIFVGIKGNAVKYHLISVRSARTQHLENII